MTPKWLQFLQLLHLFKLFYFLISIPSMSFVKHFQASLDFVIISPPTSHPLVLLPPAHRQQPPLSCHTVKILYPKSLSQSIWEWRLRGTVTSAFKAHNNYEKHAIFSLILISFGICFWEQVLGSQLSGVSFLFTVGYMDQTQVVKHVLLPTKPFHCSLIFLTEGKFYC